MYGNREQLDWHLRAARQADLIIKHSGIGADDDYIAAAVLDAAAAAPAHRRPRVAFWDVDAPHTLSQIHRHREHPMRALLPSYDFVLTYGGGPVVSAAYLALGARQCFPIYNGLDPDTHFPTARDPRFHSDLTFLGHRLPDREHRVNHFFLGAARRAPKHQFLLAGEGWQGASHPANVTLGGFISPLQHNALNASARFVLNLNRDSMAEVGFSPPTRIFEAAGARTAIISDAWPGIELFFEPGREILLATSAQTVADYLDEVSPEAASRLAQRAYERALAEHTYARRARRLNHLLQGAPVTALAA
ncbi:MAG TPA: glycosyltransferase [Terriglobales bacterium]|nr:glycosyltransferase [Terriglobales bacterium]